MTQNQVTELLRKGSDGYVGKYLQSSRDYYARHLGRELTAIESQQVSKALDDLAAGKSLIDCVRATDRMAALCDEWESKSKSWNHLAANFLARNDRGMAAHYAGASATIKQCAAELRERIAPNEKLCDGSEPSQTTETKQT